MSQGTQVVEDSTKVTGRRLPLPELSVMRIRPSRRALQAGQAGHTFDARVAAVYGGAAASVFALYLASCIPAAGLNS